MLKVGITGGIGSGKTTVCGLFRVLGIPVYYADEAARILMDTDASLVAAISALFGASVYAYGKLDRARLSAAVFGEAGKLQALNALVHPVTIRHAEAWMEAQSAPYVIKEAAIFFESGSYKAMDVMIGISAPAETRIRRAMQRSGMTREAVEARIAQQMDNEEKMRHCDYVIVNDDVEAVVPQVLGVHEVLLRRASAI